MSEEKRLPDDYKFCVEQLHKYNNEWAGDENYKAREAALDMLFKTFPENKRLEHILVKIATLNDFYSTNIFDVYAVAKHYKDEIENLDKRLNDGDVTLVDDLAKVVMVKENKKGEKEEKEKYFFSFATKYCSHHRPDYYPICDKYVCRVLKAIRSQDNDIKFYNSDLKNYQKFKEIIDKVIKQYNLDSCDCTEVPLYKQVDRYLWKLGKKYFSENESGSE